MERKDEIKPSKIPFVFSVLIMLNELYPSKGHCYIVQAAFNCNTWTLLHALLKTRLVRTRYYWDRFFTPIYLTQMYKRIKCTIKIWQIWPKLLCHGKIQKTHNHAYYWTILHFLSPQCITGRWIKICTRVFRKIVFFFTIYCNSSLAYIAVRDLQSSQRNASVQSLPLAVNFLNI